MHDLVANAVVRELVGQTFNALNDATLDGRREHHRVDNDVLQGGYKLIKDT